MAAVCVMLLAACRMDYRKKKIPNVLILSMGILGAGWRFLREGIGGAAAYLIQAAAVMCLFYFLFSLGVVGAGDVKLFGVTAGCLPFSKIFIFLFMSLLFAAMISLLKLLKKRCFWERLRYFAEYAAAVWKSGKWRLYREIGADDADAGVCLSGPILLSLLLYLGGVY